MKEDLDKLHVNYTILPDLNVGDGYIQAAFAAADAPRVRAWYEACQKDLLALGKSVGDMKEFSFEDYLGTSPKEESADKKRTDSETGTCAGTCKSRENSRENHGSTEAVKGAWICGEKRKRL